MSKTYNDRIADLSPRAKKLFARILDGKFYRADEAKTPEAMKELIAAKLVMTAGRVNVIVRCYVPVRGFVPLRVEDWKR